MITQNKISAVTGISQAHLSRIFSGQPIGRKTAQRFAELLGLTVGQVIDMEPGELEAAVKDRLAAEGVALVPDEAA